MAEEVVLAKGGDAAVTIVREALGENLSPTRHPFLMRPRRTRCR